MTDERRPATEEEEAEAFARLQEQIRQMSVSDHLVYMLESLAALATRKLGLTPDSREERDTDQARLAIDAFRALLDVLAPSRQEGEVGVHRQMLSQLQMAYVRVLQSPQEESPGKNAAEASGMAAEAAGASADESADTSAEKSAGEAEPEAEAQAGASVEGGGEE